MTKWKGFIIEDSWDLSDDEIQVKLEQYLEENFQSLMEDLFYNEPKILEFLERKTWEELKYWDWSKSAKQHAIDYEHFEDCVMDNVTKTFDEKLYSKSGMKIFASMLIHDLYRNGVEPKTIYECFVSTRDDCKKMISGCPVDWEIFDDDTYSNEKRFTEVLTYLPELDEVIRECRIEEGLPMDA
jgi:hypothetical protein